MGNRRTPTMDSSESDVRRGPDYLAVTAVADPVVDASATPSMAFLSELNTAVVRLAHQTMALTYQLRAGSAVSRASALLAEGRQKLALIEQLSAADIRARASLDGARTALLTAARELRQHMVRHGWGAEE